MRASSSHYGVECVTAAIDLAGRDVRRFGAVADRGVAWDGRDGNGTLVRAGVYFIHVHGGGQETMVRVVVLR